MQIFSTNHGGDLCLLHSTIIFEFMSLENASYSSSILPLIIMVKWCFTIHLADLFYKSYWRFLCTPLCISSKQILRTALVSSTLTIIIKCTETIVYITDLGYRTCLGRVKTISNLCTSTQLMHMK